MNTKKKNGKKYRVYTNLDLYDGNELSVGKARATEKFKTVSSPIEIKLPQI